MNAVWLGLFLGACALLASAALGEILGWAWARARSGLVHPWGLGAPGFVAALPAIGLGFAGLALLPSHPLESWFLGLCACAARGGLHLCPLHLGAVWPVVAGLVGLALILLARRLPAALAVVQRARDLEHVAVPGDAPMVRIDAGGRATAYVAGLRRPRLFVDGRWWDALPARDRDVVAAHERAHLRHGDSRALVALEALLAMFAPRARRAVVADWALASEVRADAEAAARDGDPLFVAEVLCRVARASAPAGALGVGGASLEVRVRALLDGVGPARRPGPVAWLGAALLAGVAGHGAHRVVESLLTLLA